MERHRVMWLWDHYLRKISRLHPLRQPNLAMFHLNNKLYARLWDLWCIWILWPSTSPFKRVQLIAHHLYLSFSLLQLLQAYRTWVFVLDQRCLKLLEESDLHLWRDLPRSVIHVAWRQLVGPWQAEAAHSHALALQDSVYQAFDSIFE